MSVVLLCVLPEFVTNSFGLDLAECYLKMLSTGSLCAGFSLLRMDSLGKSTNTLLYLEIPHEDVVRLNAGSRQLHKLKRHWHEHINFFTPESIDCLMNRCGLRILALESISVTTGEQTGYVFAIAAKTLDC